MAELARLIGQTDPFGDLGKQPPRAAAQQTEPVMNWSAAPAQSFAPHQPTPSVAPEAYPPHTAAHYAEPAAYDRAYTQPADDHYQTEPEVPAYLVQRTPVGSYDQHDYVAGGEGENTYDDLPPRRRLGVLAIASIFALAVIGTAGAFGYRAVFGGSGSRMPPPVIKADTAPTKIVPEGTKDSSKLVTDRVGSPGEKIVSREETPVDIKDKIATPVFPPVTTTSGQAGQPGPAMAAAGNGVVAGSEPKKVHTVVIRPDQPMVADAAPASAPQQPSPIAMPEPQPAKPAPPLAPARPQQAAQTTAPVPAPPREPARPAPARSASAPLSLNPNAGTTPAPRAPTRVANAAPTSLAAVPSANPAHGRYAVQVTSQRSEAEAQAAYRALQGKYGNVLGGRSMFVHKVELGAKGTYYRAMVGPFASQAEASQLCSSLKSAGGSCLIQRN